jgi:hypothetical protein
LKTRELPDGRRKALAPNVEPGIPMGTADFAARASRALLREAYATPEQLGRLRIIEGRGVELPGSEGTS